MNSDEKKLKRIRNSLNHLLKKIEEYEVKFAGDIEQVHPKFRRSALNLIHYMAMRDHDVAGWQNEARELGFPTYTAAETHVLDSIYACKSLVNHLLGKSAVKRPKNVLKPLKAEKLLRRNTKAQFGYESRHRTTRIMVTMPLEAAENPDFAQKLVKAGLNCARINCAHDSPREWGLMIKHIKQAAKDNDVKIKIMMDLGGPKLRTGPMVEGPKVVHIHPDRNDIGQAIHPARVRLDAEPADPNPSKKDEEKHIPVTRKFLKKLKINSRIRFNDTRGKKCFIKIDRIEKGAAYGFCFRSAYLRTGMRLTLESSNGLKQEIGQVGELLPKRQALLLRTGDRLRLDKGSIPGSNATYNRDGHVMEIAHISCDLPEVFEYVEEGHLICFDDGKIEGKILKAAPDHLEVEITQTKNFGTKLRAEKGINLPQSDLKISGLTEKDKQDLEFVAEHSDTVNYSFVNTVKDVKLLLHELAKYKSNIGIILKIETHKGFQNLPRILLEAMQTYPVGVMIARGDLAVETGWNNFASIQEEVLRICEAAHIPSVWATQVLENLAKKGTPSRPEVTDAAQAQRSECVMLNKGPYTEKAIRLLDKILIHMQRYQNHKDSIRPGLKRASQLKLDHL